MITKIFTSVSAQKRKTPISQGLAL
jgi:hypothetical protein